MSTDTLEELRIQSKKQSKDLKESSFILMMLVVYLGISSLFFMKVQTNAVIEGLCMDKVYSKSPYCKELKFNKMMYDINIYKYEKELVSLL